MAPTKKSDSSSTKMTLKLLIDKSRNRVLFAEAGKDFVDFLFGLLQLPVGAIQGLLAEHGTPTIWSIAKVYESVQSMDSNYMQSNQSKISLLSPKCRPSNTKQTPMLQQFVCTDTDSSTAHLPAFSSAPAFGVSSSPASGVSFSTTCASPSSSFSSSGPTFGVSVPAFGVASSVPAFSVSSSGSGFSFTTTGASSSSSFSSPLLKEATSVVDGYVKEMVTYMVLDDLRVKPMSTCEDVITSLNSNQVRDLGVLELKITEIDTEVALKLVKALFESTTVLTDVFLSSRT